MTFRARRAECGALLASDHDRGGGGNAERDVLTVDDTGRTTEAIVAALASVPGEFARLVAGKSDADLMRPAQDGGWGLVEILPHLRDWERIYQDRIEAILSEPEPTLEEYDDSLWAIEHGYRDQDPREAQEEFTTLRERLVERLAGLDRDGWNRVAILPKRGRVTLHWLMDSLCNHDAKHVVQARDVLA